MISTISTLCMLCLALMIQQPSTQQNEPQSRFVGKWVGVQTWAIDDAPPDRQPQPVTLTIELVDGKLAGTMSPFFGGTDVAYFSGAEIVGDQLSATATVGPPPATGSTERPPSRGFTANVRVKFDFKSGDRNNMTGTADIFMGDVKWLRFNYDLGKQRSRY